MTEWPPSPNSLKSNVGIIGQILRRFPNQVLNEAEKQGNPWTWLAEWVKRNPVEYIRVGTVQMRDAECAALEKEGFKRTDIGVYSADTKARHNAKIYQGIREIRFYFHKHDSAKIFMRIVMDGCWPEIFRKTLEAAASQRHAILRLVEVGRRGGSISQSWRLKMQDALMRGDPKAAEHWADKAAASILQMEKGRQWLLNDNVEGLHAPQEIRDEARRRYEIFYANDVRRLGRKQADKKWKNTDSLKTPLKLKRDTNGEKIAIALALGWLFVGDGFPGFCFISDKILAWRAFLALCCRFQV